MDISNDPAFVPDFTQSASNEGDAEAALEALRAAIGQPAVSDHLPETEDFTAHPSTSQQPANDSEHIQATLERALAALRQLSNTSQTILDNMNLPEVIQGLTGSLKLLVESNRRQADIVRGLVAQLSGQCQYFHHQIKVSFLIEVWHSQYRSGTDIQLCLPIRVRFTQSAV